ncbi:hypothetical protein KCP77_10660 [Salmonella enterica subsp. enterica]|nr:hypothetical protein KCP77_10660 [Salmonella enterica subsp. enterica]
MAKIATELWRYRGRRHHADIPGDALLHACRHWCGAIRWRGDGNAVLIATDYAPHVTVFNL